MKPSSGLNQEQEKYHDRMLAKYWFDLDLILAPFAPRVGEPFNLQRSCTSETFQMFTNSVAGLQGIKRRSCSSVYHNAL